MIVVDSSIVVAVYRQEADAERCALGIASDDQPIMSAANVIETSIVLRGLKMMPPAEAEQWLDNFIATAGIRIEPVTEEQTRLARMAHRRFGKGTGHGAALNYGDCFAYALAKAMGVPLLCKGNDFRLTDIALA
ncbi:MAG: type II toxin-antitoxin system VapC family toxin [Rhodopseudomonas sp.]|uniref:type II toxin-antitoxin system VapC family toxin n=1 Tax=Rhodopseudomonas sp. TaxID=1078 RepID=UPI00180A78E0|nr:type II toxin-antitoxin system VapC family toxin [Rhodopseudomonas sp.]NVN88108.1 type II toxin-antitoxin system VapC family toxin [Rhodopseudomonas sp.]